MAGGRRKGAAADCRADTRGGSWAGIPKCLIDSLAYRSLSVHARSVLIELVARMNGYNNGKIAVSQRELVDAIGCSPNRIVIAITDLMEHGILDVAVEGTWKTRQARQYRLTFVTTKGAPATNDYLRWTPSSEKSGAIGVVSEGDLSATGAIARPSAAATGAIARLLQHRRKSVDRPLLPATGAVSLIGKPSPADQSSPVDIPFVDPPNAGGDFLTNKIGSSGDERQCEQCHEPFALDRSDRRFPRRFCSEPCRKKAERSRAYQRRKQDQPPALQRP